MVWRLGQLESGRDVNGISNRECDYSGSCTNGNPVFSRELASKLLDNSIIDAVYVTAMDYGAFHRAH